jgi:hypothetical protein
MQMLKKSVVVFAAACVMTGCASIMNDGKQKVAIKTVPEGAEVVVDGRTVVTPAIVELKGKSEYYISANKKGYKSATGKVEGDVRIGSGVIGNIFNFSGFIGMAVDFWGTGAGWRMQDNVEIALQKEE